MGPVPTQALKVLLVHRVAADQTFVTFVLSYRGSISPTSWVYHLT